MNGGPILLFVSIPCNNTIRETYGSNPCSFSCGSVYDFFKSQSTIDLAFAVPTVTFLFVVPEGPVRLLESVSEAGACSFLDSWIAVLMQLHGTCADDVRRDLSGPGFLTRKLNLDISKSEPEERSKSSRG
jgi:hypothetical protein